uniref:Uncharacterized protein n=1 Tax=Avena sativa TaxID=4498 RepID=A0ACD5TPN6_AVESA
MDAGTFFSSKGRAARRSITSPAAGRRPPAAKGEGLVSLDRFMGRAPCCEKEGLRSGAWSPEEDQLLADYIAQHGHPNWRALPRLLRCGKSCRLRWINYLRPDIKRGNFTADEEDHIIRLHQSLGNRWSAIAAQLSGRTDNEIKNVWHTSRKKRVDEDRKSTTGRRRQKVRKEAKAKSATVNADVKHEQGMASPGRSSSGVTCSTVTVTESVWSAIAAQLPGRTDNEIKNVWHTSLKKRVDEDRKSTTGRRRQKVRKEAKAKSATVNADVKHEQGMASPGRSSSGVTCSTVTVTESVSALASSPAYNATMTSTSHGHELVKEVSSAVVIDGSFWSSTDLKEVMDPSALDTDLSLTTSSSWTRNEDMEFWLNILHEAGDMRDLAIL